MYYFFLSNKKATQPHFPGLPAPQIGEQNLLARINKKIHAVNQLLISYVVTGRERLLMAAFYNLHGP